MPPDTRSSKCFIEALFFCSGRVLLNPKINSRRSRHLLLSTYKKEQHKPELHRFSRSPLLSPGSNQAAMPHRRESVLLILLLLVFLSAAGVPLNNEIRLKTRLSSWNPWPSDFYDWLGVLQSRSRYPPLQYSWRSYWTRFPVSGFLGYGIPLGDTEASELEDLK
ncbi:hypothetical protein DNTS_013355 [Danionella cerebrum]|uniref:Uncharacterized protein n=1 Tax=Danionella cerebrum TaxID=2873325 RepID=A0A553MKR0_9TELE|nr:hypothetical protein DNTS_013355 [Danionella translucida]